MRLSKAVRLCVTAALIIALGVAIGTLSAPGSAEASAASCCNNQDCVDNFPHAASCEGGASGRRCIGVGGGCGDCACFDCCAI